MVNLYDSPAQSQFMNTYVPIQFEGLYKIADKAQKNLDEAQAMEDSAISNYSTINTPIAAHQERWKAKTTDLMNTIHSKINSVEDLKDPMIQSELKSKIRRLQSDQDMANMLESAKNAKEFIKKSDPRWGSYESDKAKSWNGDGIFGEQNMSYSNWGEQSAKSVSEMEPTVLSLNQVPKELRRAGFQYTGVTNDMVKGVVQGLASELINNPANKAKADIDFRSGMIPEQYITKDANGAVVGYNPQYIVDKEYAAHSGKDRIIDKVDPIWQMNYEHRLRMSERVLPKDKTESQDDSAVDRARELFSGTVRNNKIARILNTTQAEIGNVSGAAAGLGSSYTFGKEGHDLLRFRNDVNRFKLQREQASKDLSPEGRRKLAEMDNALFSAKKNYAEAEERALYRYNAEAGNVISGGKSRLSKSVLELDNTTVLPDPYIKFAYDAQFGITPKTFKMGRSNTNIYGYQGASTANMKLADKNGMSPVKTAKAYVGKLKGILESGAISSTIFSPTTHVSGGGASGIVNSAYVYIPKNELEARMTDDELSRLKASGYLSEVSTTDDATIKDPVNGSLSSQEFVVGKMYKVHVLKDYPESTTGGSPIGYTVDSEAKKQGFGSLPATK